MKKVLLLVSLAYCLFANQMMDGLASGCANVASYKGFGGNVEKVSNECYRCLSAVPTQVDKTKENMGYMLQKCIAEYKKMKGQK